ncbi:hypothetical protein VTO73DRAFT_4311 [Trametes versicolor]
MTSHIVKVDNTDPRIIYRNIEQFGPYHGRGWTTLNGASEDEAKQGAIYNNSLQVAALEDISLEFTFSGLSVAVYGSIRPPTASFAPLTTSKYSVIGYDYAGIPAMAPYVASNVTSPVNNVNFWSQSGMPNKTYTLWVNITSSTANMPYYLDYIAIEVPGPGPSSSASSASSSATSGTSSASATATTSDTSSSTSTASATSAPVNSAFARGSSVPKGAIIGAAIGGTAVLLVLLLSLLRWYKRRPKPPPDYDYGSVAQQDSPPHIMPFVNPTQAAAMEQTGDRGLMFVPGLPPSSPSFGSGLQSPDVLPSQKALAMEAARRGTMDGLGTPGAGSSTIGSDRKDGAAFLGSSSGSRPHTPGAASEAGSSSGPSNASAPGYVPPPQSELRHALEDEESPPAYTPA